MKLHKYEGNPILSPNPKNEWENLCVLNPAVWYDGPSGTFYMLYRAAGDTDEHFMYLGLATSKDGFCFERASDQPALGPDKDGPDGGGIEDPRIFKDGGFYYITYAARPYAPGRYWLNAPKPWFDPPPLVRAARENATMTNLAVTRDFKRFKKLGRMTDAREDDRDVILFPEKTGGRFARLSRPMERCGEGYPCKVPSTWIAFSDDLLEWGEPSLLFEGSEWWEDYKSGGSCPPIKTDRGWFVLYHGVSRRDGEYRVGALMLDLDDPTRILAKTRDFILEAEADFEKKGNYNGCVFPTAACVKDGTLYVYYGAADCYVCVATADFDALVSYVLEQGNQGE